MSKLEIVDVFRSIENTIKQKNDIKLYRLFECVLRMVFRLGIYQKCQY